MMKPASLRPATLLPVLLLLAAAGCTSLSKENSMTSKADNSYDFWIRGGTVIDGTGAPGRQADVLVRDGKIVQVGKVDLKGAHIERIIDATGKVVTPGFIDAHAHGEPLEHAKFHNCLAMGVTTISLGQDGESPEMPDPTVWMDEVDAAKPGVNIALFVGHGTLRNQAGVGLREDLGDADLEKMQQIAATSMDAGCWGLSTGLEYDPGRFADERELIAVARPVCDRGGMVMSHMRSEDDDKIADAVGELLAQGLGAGCDVHVAHMKVTYGKGAKRAEQLLASMDAARKQGIRVTADMYPYTASYTTISIVFPDWARPPYDFDEVVRTRRAELEEYLRKRIAQRNGPEATLFGSEPWTGKTLAEVADELGKPFEDVLIDDIKPGGASAAYFVMDEPLQERLMQDPHVMFCSDGSETGMHPRGHGAFARVIRVYVNEKRLLTLEEAVHKMTGLTAETMHLDTVGRGRLEPGYFADILVFDPAEVRDTATYDQPHQLAEGFDTVLVNGQLVRDAGEFTGPRAGRVLRKGESAR